jgi:hypothetical protein|uniref:Uncharacterized protein n=1 Tax=Zea mays TaxID=4577 RepID=A0A804MSV0_MAIZE
MEQRKLRNSLARRGRKPRRTQQGDGAQERGKQGSEASSTASRAGAGCGMGERAEGRGHELRRTEGSSMEVARSGDFEGRTSGESRRTPGLRQLTGRGSSGAGEPAGEDAMGMREVRAQRVSRAGRAGYGFQRTAEQRD